MAASSPTITLILGGGVGGITLARHLRHLLPATTEHRIVLIEQKTTFSIGATNLWIALGEYRSKDVTVRVSDLVPEGVDLLHTSVTKIDLQTGEACFPGGTVRGDYLAIALGAATSFSSIPGLEAAAHSFYTQSEAKRLRQTLRRFSGGDVAMSSHELHTNALLLLMSALSDSTIISAGKALETRFG